jgi:hypothetical protein
VGEATEKEEEAYKRSVINMALDFKSNTERDFFPFEIKKAAYIWRFLSSSFNEKETLLINISYYIFPF